MRKILLFVLGAMMVFPLYADNYELQSDGTYSYTGEPVSELSVDFTTWSTSDLPTTLYDDMPLSESHNMGFVKWKITSRNCGSKGTVNALFNNDYADFSDGGASVRNNATTNKPRVYLPTTTGGVKKITVFAGNSNVSLGVRYKDEKHSSWTWGGSLVLVASFGVAELELNTEGQTSIFIEHGNTPYVAITNLDLEIEQEEEPVFQYNSSTGQYDYIGVPVDELNVDFTSWKTIDLPASFTDDMELAQKNGIGFVKWKIAERTCGEKGKVNALFNNDNADFSEGGDDVKNNNTTNKPRIFLPTTARGVKSIKVFGGAGGQSLGIYYKDANQSSWKWKASLTLPTEFAEVTVDLNTTGMTSIYLSYDRTVFPAITNLELEIEEPSYVLNTETGVYEYQGDPVDAISLDFSTWKYADLPGSLREDYPLIEAHNVGFIKWKLPWYNPGSPFTARRVLCNDNTNDAGVSEPNNTTTNKPAIYFPTTVRGIESVAITYVSGTSAFWLNYSYTDGLGTISESVQLPASQASDPQTFVLNLNTAGATSLHFLYAMTAWVRILSIEFTIKDSENTPLGLWDYTTSTGNMSKLTDANGQVRDVYLKRAFVADGAYYTLCLPFDLSEGQVAAAFGSCTLAKLVSSSLVGSEIQLTFDNVNHIEAGVPYLFLPDADIEELEFPGVTIDTDAPTAINTSYFCMTGVYNPTSLTSEDYFLGADNYLVPVSGDSPLRPFRAYFTIVEGNSAPAGAPARVVFNTHHATGMESMVGPASALSTRKVFRDGQLYILRNGVEYNAAGQMVK